MPQLSTTPLRHSGNKTLDNLRVVILSNREKEVLLLIAYEYTNQEIADRLFLSKGTIATYRNNLLSKLRAKNTAGIVRIAFEKNILTLNEKCKTGLYILTNQNSKPVIHYENNVVHNNL